MDGQTTKPATIGQARKRWREHTCHVLSGIARACAKNRTVWTMQDGYPVIELGDKATFRFRFAVDGRGTVFAEIA